MTKTIKELNYNELYVEYKVLNKIDAATANERFAVLFNDLIKQCAEKLYEGDEDNIVLHRALYRNLVSDKRTRFNNVDRYYDGYLPERTLKMALVDLIDSLLPVEKRTVVKHVADKATGKAAKAYWKYTEEDVLAVQEVDVLNSIINNISTAKSRMIEQAMTEFSLSTEEEVVARFDAVRTLAREQKQKLSKVVPSDGLMAKIAKGGHTTLSAAEVEELKKLLG